MSAFVLSRVPAVAHLHLGTIPPDKHSLADRLQGLWGFLRHIDISIEDIYTRKVSETGKYVSTLIKST
jgi:hypothetical protein